MKQTLILAALLAAALASAPANAGLWRMYTCVGDHGETVFSDRSGVGTDCREMWIEGTDLGGYMITEGQVKTAEPARETDHAGY